MPIDYEDLRRAADAAPSVLNTKPWSLSSVADDRIELRADWTRRLEAVDPRHRELIISCGAALFNVRMAIRVTGHALASSLVPYRQSQGDACPHCQAQGLLASVEVELGRLHPATDGEQRLYEAIPLRQTARKPFSRSVERRTAVELELTPLQEQGVSAKLPAIAQANAGAHKTGLHVRELRPHLVATAGRRWHRFSGRRAPGP